jgi:hypothetical protein
VETIGLMSDEAADSVILPQSKRNKIFAYLGILIVLLAFGAPSGGLIDLPISFFLKNKLHLQASELANFRLVAALEMARSNCNPRSKADCGRSLRLMGAV